MRKGSEWYKLLGDKEKMKFKHNCGNEFDEAMSDSNTFISFIARYFDWTNSREGHLYWREIANRQL